MHEQAANNPETRLAVHRPGLRDRMRGLVHVRDQGGKEGVHILICFVVIESAPKFALL